MVIGYMAKEKITQKISGRLSAEMPYTEQDHMIPETSMVSNTIKK